MRPARTITAVTVAIAAVVTGSYLAVSTAHSSAAAPTAPVTAPPPSPTHPVDFPQAAGPARPVCPAPRPVLADGRYDSYIRTVDSHRNRLVVDLVQVFDWPGGQGRGHRRWHGPRQGPVPGRLCPQPESTAADPAVGR